MNRFLPFAMVVLALPAQGGGADPPGARIVVAPFASLSGRIPQGTSVKAQAMLVTELRSTGAFTVVVEPRQGPGVDGAREALELARAAVLEAQGLRSHKKLGPAAEALARARKAFWAAATAPPDVGELIDCYALESAVAYAMGRDDDGQSALSTALALAPDRELPLARTSPLFARLVDEARRALQAGPKGSMLVSSTPTNAPVTLDGRPAGVTPLSVKEVPPGPHLWTAWLSTGETVGGVVEVTAGRTVELSARPSQLDATGRLLAGLATNRLDEAAMLAARELARASQAGLVLFGALSAEGKGLALDSFLLSVEWPAPRRLPRRAFDLELLSASMELYALAGELSHASAAPPAALVKLPAPVSLTLGGATGVAEAKYGTTGSEPSTPPGDVTFEPPTPAGPRRRVPLKTR